MNLFNKDFKEGLFFLIAVFIGFLLLIVILRFLGTISTILSF